MYFRFRVEDGRLQASAIIPGLRVQYSADNGHTWRDVSNETILSKNVKIGTRLVSLGTFILGCAYEIGYTSTTFEFQSSYFSRALTSPC